MHSLLHLIEETDPLTILDVGAAVLGTPPYQSLLDRRRCRLIGFEPNQEALSALEARYGAPHRFFPYFIGDGSAAVFHETNRGPTGSWFEPNTPLLELFSSLAEVVTPVARHKVQTKRLDDLSEVSDVDFFKIDVQGGELAVFQNASRVLDEATLIQVEVSFLERSKGQPLFAEVDAFLRSKGFQFHDFVGFERGPFKALGQEISAPQGRQVLWSDAYYVKDWMRFDQISPRKLIRLAVLPNDIDMSADLAFLALQAADRVGGTELSVAYRKRLASTPAAVTNSASTTPELPDPLFLETTSGVEVCVPSSLDCITTYVLLEQERWFEKELEFLLRWVFPGMTVVDVGANCGIYSLPIARRIGAAGRVFAYEPGTENRKNLERGVARNHLNNLTISAHALADEEKNGWLQIASSGELNSLGSRANGGSGEEVAISCLDTQLRLFGWDNVDFVKIDAEGQESRIVAGGREFFTRQSPLVMFEIKDRSSHNDALRWMFSMLGYETYRLVGDGSCLIPVGSDDVLDEYELNLFAAKPDRAEALAKQGLLVHSVDDSPLNGAERNAAIDALIIQPFAQTFHFSAADIRDCPFSDAFTAYAAVRYLDLPSSRRIGLLSLAYASLSAAEQSSPSALSTFARIALDLGARAHAISALDRLLKGGEALKLTILFFLPRYASSLLDRITVTRLIGLLPQRLSSA